MTVSWPIISMPLPEGSRVAVSFDYFGPLPVTPRGNTYILLFTDRFRRRADMFPVTAAEFTAEGTANILVNQYIPLWGFPRTILSDNGLQCYAPCFCKLCLSCWTCTSLVQAPIIPTVTEALSGVNQTMAQMLAMVVNERHDD